ALDAASRHRAGELAALGDRELRPDGPGRGPPRRDDRRERDALPLAAPALDGGEDVLHAAKPSADSSERSLAPMEEGVKAFLAALAVALAAPHAGHALVAGGSPSAPCGWGA